MRKIISIFLSFGLLFQQSGLLYAAGEINLANYLNQAKSAIVQPDVFQPARLRYISYDSRNNDFKLFLDKGDAKLNDATQELFKYFLIGLSLPNDTFWVNLRPDAPENIIDPLLEKTDIGKIFLEADLQLKKDTSNLTSPQNPEGKAYWDKLYKKAGELFGTENITIPTITRPWIVPNEVIVRETEDSAYIYKATLKVMLEADYLANQKTEKPKNQKTEEYSFFDPRLKELNEYSSQIIRETIIPKLTREVNSSKRYAKLRQVYYSLVLARWFKQKYGSLGSVRAPEHQSTGGSANNYISLIDSGNLANLASQEPCDKQAYFQAYQKSFKDGEYNLKETVATAFGQSIRSYISGGIGMNVVSSPAAMKVRDNYTSELLTNSLVIASSSPMNKDQKYRRDIWEMYNMIRESSGGRKGNLESLLLLIHYEEQDPLIVACRMLQTIIYHEGTYLGDGSLMDLIRRDSQILINRPLYENTLTDAIKQNAGKDKNKDEFFEKVLRLFEDKKGNVEEIRKGLLELEAIKEYQKFISLPKGGVFISNSIKKIGDAILDARERFGTKESSYVFFDNLVGEVVRLQEQLIAPKNRIKWMEEKMEWLGKQTAKNRNEREAFSALLERFSVLIQENRDLDDTGSFGNDVTKSTASPLEEGEFKEWLEYIEKGLRSMGLSVRALPVGEMWKDVKGIFSEVILIVSKLQHIPNPLTRVDEILSITQGLKGKLEELRSKVESLLSQDENLEEKVKADLRSLQSAVPIMMLPRIRRLEKRLQDDSASPLTAEDMGKIKKELGEYAKILADFYNRLSSLDLTNGIEQMRFGEDYKNYSRDLAGTLNLQELMDGVRTAIRLTIDKMPPGYTVGRWRRILGNIEWIKNRIDLTLKKYAAELSEFFEDNLYKYFPYEEKDKLTDYKQKYGRQSKLEDITTAIKAVNTVVLLHKKGNGNNGNIDVIEKWENVVVTLREITDVIKVSSALIQRGREFPYLETVGKVGYLHYARAEELTPEERRSISGELEKWVEKYAEGWNRRIIEQLISSNNDILSKIRLAIGGDGKLLGYVHLNDKDDYTIDAVQGKKEGIEVALAVSLVEELMSIMGQKKEERIIKMVHYGPVEEKDKWSSNIRPHLTVFWDLKVGGNSSLWQDIMKSKPEIWINKNKAEHLIATYRNYIEKKMGSSALTNESAVYNVESRGGIDLTDRFMRLKIERTGGFADLKLFLPQVKNAQGLDLDKEFRQIETMASSGIVPSSRRILELFSACYARGEFGKRLSQVISCLKASSAIQENLGLESDDDFRLCLLLPEIFSDGG